MSFLEIQEDQYDALIIGGGMIGLSAAKGLSDKGLNVAVVELQAPILEWDETAISLRVSAINRASEIMLRKLAVWKDIFNMRKHISPYHEMHVWDALGGGSITLQAQQAGETELGYIIENRVIVRTLWQALENNHVPFYLGNAIQEIRGTAGNWQVVLASGKVVAAKLLIGADGANSWVRNKFAFETNVEPYEHSAIVATVRTEKAHNTTAWQRFLATGPLAFLPMADKNLCSIVWSAETERAKNLMLLDDESFNHEMNVAFDLKLGECKVESKRVSFPLIQRHAKIYCQVVVVLIGDAAHTIHPLAGQGVNLGFQDAITLVDVLSEAHLSGRSISHLGTLEKYQRQRQGQNQSMIYAMKGFKTLFGFEIKPIADIRSFGLNVADKLPFVKRLMIKQAMGIL
jgi:2-octaprenylphenol hydroxylase